MPKVRCNYTNCFYNDAFKGSDTGRCINTEIELNVYYTDDNKECHECKSYVYQDKGESYRRS